MKKFLAAAAAVALTLAMVATPSLAASAEEGNQPPHAGDQVTICHSPSSATNPWVEETVSVNAMKSPAGHIDPSDEDTHDDDIIPEFTYDVKNDANEWVSVTYPGKNLSTLFGDATGAAILANDCAIPAAVIVTTVTPTLGDNEFTVEWDEVDEDCVPGEGDEAGETTPGSIAFTFDPNDDGVEKLEYSVKDSGVWTTAASHDLISGLDAGTYTIRITVEDGYDLIGDEEFDVTIGEDKDPKCKKVTICHWDQSEKWTSITVSEASLQGAGHIDPSTQDTHAFDIVPPFDDYGGKNYNDTSDNVDEYLDEFPFNGLTGEAILEAGCKDPVIEEEEDEVAVGAEPTDEDCDPESESVLPGSIVLTVLVNGSAVTLPEDDKVTVEVKGPGATAFSVVTSNTLTGLSDGTYQFKVSVTEGYVLTSPRTFSEVVGNKDVEDCGLSTEGPIDPKPIFTPATCEANGSYTLTSPPAEEGLPSPSVFWYVNDVLTADGTYSVVAPATITVRVVANDGYTFLDITTEMTFDPYRFTVPTACSLTTLALTGSSDTATPALALTAFLGLLGLAMVRSGIRVNRNRQEA